MIDWIILFIYLAVAGGLLWRLRYPVIPHVTVQAPQVTVYPPTVTVELEPPQVLVTPPAVTVNPPNIVVDPPKVEIFSKGRPPGKKIELRLMDANMRSQDGVYHCEDNKRPPNLTYNGCQYMAAKQDEAGNWLYRNVGRTRGNKV